MTSIDAGGLRSLVVLARDRVIPRVDELGTLQNADGSIGVDLPRATHLLRAVVEDVTAIARRTGQAGYADALCADVEGWIAAGLETAPHFDSSRDAYTPPANLAATVACLPFEATNGARAGRRLEFLFAIRHEPAELLAEAEVYPLPEVERQSMRLVCASRGLRVGNCIALFPESVAAATPVRRQHFGMFFLNKFQRIYTELTLPAARRVLVGPGAGREDGWRTADLDPATCYSARCLWAYLHDYCHHQGPRPLHRNLKVKQNWFVGLLEETKVDAQAVLVSQRTGGHFGAEILEFMLLERIFRYPTHPAAVRNFDAGSGLLMYTWLRATGALKTEAGGRLSIDWGRSVSQLAALAAAIVAIEESVEDDLTYKERAREFVHRYLPPPSAEGDRFSVSDDQVLVARPATGTAPIEFTFDEF